MRFDIGRVLSREAALLARRKSRDMAFAIGEPERQGEIVGDAVCAEFGEDWKVDRAGGVGEAAADRLARPADHDDRARAKHLVLGQRIGGVHHLQAFAGAPEKHPAHDARMQRVDEHGDPPQRQAAGGEAVAKFAEHGLRACRRARAVDQPGGGRRDAQCAFSPGHRYSQGGRRKASLGPNGTKNDRPGAVDRTDCIRRMPADASKRR